MAVLFPPRVVKEVVESKAGTHDSGGVNGVVRAIRAVWVASIVAEVGRELVFSVETDRFDDGEEDIATLQRLTRSERGMAEYQYL